MLGNRVVRTEEVEGELTCWLAKEVGILRCEPLLLVTSDAPPSRSELCREELSLPCPYPPFRHQVQDQGSPGHPHF